MKLRALFLRLCNCLLGLESRSCGHTQVYVLMLHCLCIFVKTSLNGVSVGGIIKGVEVQVEKYELNQICVKLVYVLNSFIIVKSGMR